MAKPEIKPKFNNESIGNYRGLPFHELPKEGGKSVYLSGQQTYGIKRKKLLINNDYVLTDDDNGRFIHTKEVLSREYLFNLTQKQIQNSNNPRHIFLPMPRAEVEYKKLKPLSDTNNIGQYKDDKKDNQQTSVQQNTLDELNNDKKVLQIIYSLKKKYNIKDTSPPFKLSTNTGNENKISEVFKKIFGQTIFIVEATRPEYKFFRGANLPSGTTVINAQKTKEDDFNFVSLTGHELLHYIKKENLGIYNWFRSQVGGKLKDGALDKYKQHLEDLGQVNLSNSLVIEELIADFVGDNISDPEFLNSLAKDNPTKFQQLLDLVVDFYTNINKKLRGFDSKQYFNDINDLQESLKAVLNEFNEKPDLSYF